MDLATFQQLLTPPGQQILNQAYELAPTEKSYLRCHDQLAKHHPGELVHAALDTVLLRQRAAGKFTLADQMYFTREALEQSSSEIVADYRSKRFRSFQSVADLGCGIGGDTIGLASVCHVTAIERDELRLAMARENANVYGRSKNVSLQRATLESFPLPDVQALFVDPSRRRDGKRYLSIHDYEPPWSLLQQWSRTVPAMAVKIAPGVSWSELDELDCEVEFISIDGELKECVLWFEPLATSRRRATILPSGKSIVASEPAESSGYSVPLRFIVEPDPAVIRAGLVTNLAKELDAAQMHRDIAYLTSDAPIHSPFAKAHVIEDWFPFQQKKLRQWLRARNVGRVTIKKRGFAIDPNRLFKQLKLDGDEERTIFLTRIDERPIVIIASPVGKPAHAAISNAAP